MPRCRRTALCLLALCCGVVQSAELGEDAGPVASCNGIALNQVLRAVEKELSSETASCKKRKKEAAKAQKKLAAGLKTCESALTSNKGELSTSEQSVRDWEVQVKTATKNRDNCHKEVNDLILKLSLLRGKSTAQMKKLSANMAQMDKAIRKARLHPHARTLRKTSRDRLQPAASRDLTEQATTLQELGKKLSAALPSETAGDDLELPHEGTGFLQMRAQREVPSDGGEDPTVLALVTDKRDLLEADEQFEKTLKDKEAALLKLIKTKRGECLNFEEDIAKKTPELSEARKRVGELQLAIEQSKRCIARDKKISARQKKISTLVDAQGCAAPNKLRNKLLSSLKEANVFMKNAQKKTKFVQEETHALNISRSLDFVQMRMRTVVPDDAADLEDIMRTALNGGAPAATASVAVPETGSEKPDSDAVVAPDVALAQEEAADAATANDASGGVFDSVIAMINGLIDRMKKQANADVGENQFCVDSTKENDEKRRQLKDQARSLNAFIALSVSTITRQNATVRYLEQEKARLKSVRKKLSDKHLEAEDTKLDTFLEGYESFSTKLVSETKCCKGSSFMQEKARSASHGDKLSTWLNGGVTPAGTPISVGVAVDDALEDSTADDSLNMVAQAGTAGKPVCASALDSLAQATKLLSQLEKQVTGYQSNLSSLIQTAVGEISAAQDELETKLAAAKVALSTTQDAAVQMKVDKGTTATNLAATVKAGEVLASRCNPVKKPEDRQAALKLEIQSLKDALKVLGGESMSSLQLNTGTGDVQDQDSE